MRSCSPKRLWLALVLLSVAADGACGQWRIVAPKLTTVVTYYGAMCFRGGIVWIADNDTLYMSPDTGMTWIKKPLPDQSFDIDFYDSLNGVLSGLNDAWITRDAGTTWHVLLSEPTASDCFLNSPNSIALAERSGGFIGVTVDGGITWRNNLPAQQNTFCVRYKAGTIYESGGTPNPGSFVHTSSDFGLTWQQGTTAFDEDSYCFAVDSCDPNRIYVAHEDAAIKTDPFSKILRTTDRGNTWQTMVSQPEPYFSGSIAEGKSALYCPTTSNGVFRSTDQGVTWSAIGGPSITFDTRLIAAMNDNVLLAVDNAGNVWRTDNSGGDSITSIHTSSLLLLSRTLQSVSDTTCSSKDTSFRLGGTGCPGVTLDSVSITGSSVFSIGDTRGTPRTLDSLDSVRIVFTPRPPGNDTSYLHLKYDLGSGSSDTVITLVGHSTRTPSLLTLSPTTQSVVDTSCSPKDTAFKLGGTGCPGVTLERVTLSGSSAFTIGDARNMPRTLDSLDSVRIVFTPTPPGVDTTYLHLQYNTGSGSRDTIITLIGSSKSTANTLSLAPTTESVLDTVCNVKDTSFRLGGTGCPGVTLVSATMTGSSAFSISDARKTPRTLDSLDSVRVVYAPTPPGLDTSYLHLVYNSGSGNHDTTITLIGTLASSVRAVKLETVSSPQTVQATCIPLSIPIPLWLTGCLVSGGRLDSAWLVGSPAIHISDTRNAPRGLGSTDSIQLQYQPGATAPDTAVLHLRYDLGSGTQDTTITVIGTIINPLPPPAITLSASTESILSKSCGGSDTNLQIGITGCPLQNGKLDSAWITGSPTIQINDSRSMPRTLGINDSIDVQYSPTGGGSDTAELHVRYDLGSGPQDTVLTVIGTVGSPLLSQPARMHRESASAYYGGIDSLPLQLDITTPVNFDSLWNLVTDIQGTCVFDPTVVSAVQYLPPVPWTLLSFTAHVGSFDFEIRNSAKRAQNPLDLGTALFRPKSSELATSWVTMSRLILSIGKQTSSLCVVDNEDNHWAVKTLGIATSDISEVPAPAQDISIRPNPTNGNVWISSTDDVGAVTIEVYDMLGTMQSEVSGQIDKNNPLELLLPSQSGVYNIVLRSLSGTRAERVVMVH